MRTQKKFFSKCSLYMYIITLKVVTTLQRDNITRKIQGVMVSLDEPKFLELC